MTPAKDNPDNWKISEVSTAIVLSMVFIWEGAMFFKSLTADSPWTLDRIVSGFLQLIALIYIPAIWMIIRNAHRSLQHLLAQEYSVLPEESIALALRTTMTRVLGISCFGIFIVAMSFHFGH